MTTTDLAELRTIAEQIETVGGWHIAALKVIGAAEEIAELRRENLRLRDIINPGEAAGYEEGMAALQAEIGRLTAQLAEVREMYLHFTSGVETAKLKADLALARAEAKVNGASAKHWQEECIKACHEAGYLRSELSSLRKQDGGVKIERTPEELAVLRRCAIEHVAPEDRVPAEPAASGKQWVESHRAMARVVDAALNGAAPEPAVAPVRRYSGGEIHRGITIDNYKHLRELEYVLASDYEALLHGRAAPETSESDWQQRAIAAEGILSHNMALANATTRRTMDERNGIIRKLREKYSAIEIADMAGLTRQRVHQILNEAPAEAESSLAGPYCPDTHTPCLRMCQQTCHIRATGAGR